MAPGCELVLGFDSPTSVEKQGFLKGVFEAALIELDCIPFVCVRFGQSTFDTGGWQHKTAIGWQECPVHPVAAQGYVPPAPNDPDRWLLSIVLVDSETQLVVGLRVVSLSTEFCRAFSDTMLARRDDFASVKDYSAKLRDIYRRYPVGEIIANGRQLAHSLGGD